MRVQCRSDHLEEVCPMSALVPPTTWQWSPEVLQFAASRQVAAYLDPFLEATRKLFPGARTQSVRRARPGVARRDVDRVRGVCSPGRCPQLRRGQTSLV